MKHIRIRYHSVHEMVARDELTIACVSSNDNAADILTKPLNHSDFLRLRSRLGLLFLDLPNSSPSA